MLFFDRLSVKGASNVDDASKGFDVSTRRICFTFFRFLKVADSVAVSYGIYLLPRHEESELFLKKRIFT